MKIFVFSLMSFVLVHAASAVTSNITLVPFDSGTYAQPIAGIPGSASTSFVMTGITDAATGASIPDVNVVVTGTVGSGIAAAEYPNGPGLLSGSLSNLIGVGDLGRQGLGLEIGYDGIELGTGESISVSFDAPVYLVDNVFPGGFGATESIDIFANGTLVGNVGNGSGAAFNYATLASADPTLGLYIGAGTVTFVGASGNNAAAIRNLRVIVVPEPSRSILGLLGVAFAFLRRRR